MTKALTTQGSDHQPTQVDTATTGGISNSPWIDWICLRSIGSAKSLWLSLPVHLGPNGNADVIIPHLSQDIIVDSHHFNDPNLRHAFLEYNLSVQGPYAWIRGVNLPKFIMIAVSVEEVFAKHLPLALKKFFLHEKNLLARALSRFLMGVSLYLFSVFTVQVYQYSRAKDFKLPDDTVRVDDSREIKLSHTKTRSGQPLGMNLRVAIPEDHDAKTHQLVLTGKGLALDEEKEIVIRIEDHAISTFPEDLFCAKGDCFINAPIPAELTENDKISIHLQHRLPQSSYVLKEIRVRSLPLASQDEMQFVHDELRAMLALEPSRTALSLREQVITKTIDKFTQLYFPPAVRKLFIQVIRQQEMQKNAFLSQSFDRLKIRLKSGNFDGLDAELRQLEDLLSIRDKESRETIENLRRQWNEVKS